MNLWFWTNAVCVFECGW